MNHKHGVTSTKYKKIIALVTSTAAALSMFTGAYAIAEEPTTKAVNDIAINATNFPDGNFRTYIQSFDTDKNGTLSTDEISAVTGIYASVKDITDLTGIQYFTNITTLYADRNKLTSVDLSALTELQTLEIGDNQLTTLDLSKNTKLTRLAVENNKLTPALDLSNSSKLRSINVSGNTLAALRIADNHTPSLSFITQQNQQPVTVTAVNGVVDLTQIAPWFDTSKVANLTNAKLDGTKLTDINGSTVTFNYRNLSSATQYLPVTLNITDKPQSADGSITITGSAAQLTGRTFDVYQIATYKTSEDSTVTDVTTNNTNKTAVDAAVKASVADEGFFDNIGDTDLLSFAIDNGKLPVSPEGDYTTGAARTFADNLASHIGNETAPLTKVTGDKGSFTIDVEAAAAGSYTYTPDEPGLYLFKDVTKGSAQATTSATILVGTKTSSYPSSGTIAIKNAAAGKVVITVAAGTINGSVAVNDTVTYQLAYTATKDNPNNFVFTNTPGVGLTIPADSTITLIDTTDKSITFVADTDYTISKLPLTGNGTIPFTVTLTAPGLAKIKNGHALTLTYTATAGEAASIVNTATVTDNGATSAADSVKISEGNITFTKIGADKAHHNGLQEAEFTLYASADDAKNAKNAIDIVESNESGKVTFNGLKAGTYYVKETKTPTGYLAKYQPGFKVELTATQDDKTQDVRFSSTFSKDTNLADYGLVKDANGVWTVTNIQRQDQLPQTGATGIALFVALGLLLIIGGAAVIQRSRKALNAMA